MQDAECVALLRWALPRLGLRWRGFRRVHRQVCKRLARRIEALQLADVAAYRARLASVREEWSELDALCRITISRFYRDRAVFDHLGATVLPKLAAAALARGEPAVRCWSAGCGSGEEPYSLALLWAFRFAASVPGLSLAVVATDADEHLLARAARGCYPRATLRELPPAWIDEAFTRDDALYCLRPAFRGPVRFLRQDIRATQPEGPFDLVLCRNLAFTYFDAALQRRVLTDIAVRLRPGGALVLGAKETIPDAAPFVASAAGFGVYWKAASRCRSSMIALASSDSKEILAMTIALKRAYEPAAASDGYRVLVDRVWPRGVAKDQLRIDDWRKDLAPSTGLRKWFGHDPKKWDAFRERYDRELEQHADALDELLAQARSGRLTLVFGARDTEHNNAVALKEHLERRLKR